MQYPDTADSLSGEQQLNVALQTVDAFAGWVTNADTKIATLSAAQVAMVLFVAGQPVGRAWPVTSVTSGGALASLLLFVLSFAVSAWHLGSALRPRIDVPPTLNHFRFPAVAEAQPSELGDTTIATLARQSWAQAQTLAVIAVTRYRHFSRALGWTGVAVVALAGVLLTT